MLLLSCSALSRGFDVEPLFELGKAIQVRAGKDVTLMSTGGMLHETVEVARRLEAEGVDARVLSMHTVKPLDAAAVLRAARETAAVLTIEEHRITGGMGSAVADVLAESQLRLPRFRKFGVPDELYHRIGSQTYLREMAGDLFETVYALLKQRKAA